MPDVLIVNASPLILPAKTNRLQLLTDMANEVVVPEGVAAEVLSAIVVRQQLMPDGR